MGLLLALLLAPPASAGTEANPEVDDSPDQRDPSLDLLSAWLEPHRDGVRFTLKLAGFAETPKDRIYYLIFGLEGQRHFATIGFDGEGRVRSFVGPGNLNARGVRGVEGFPTDSPLVDVEVRQGSPGTITARLPWGAVEGLSPAATLLDIAAGTTRYSRADRTWVDEDVRFTSSTFVARKPLLPAWMVAAAPVVVGGLVVAAGAAAGTWAMVRRRPRGDKGGAPKRTLRPGGPDDAARAEGGERREGPKFHLRPPQ